MRHTSAALALVVATTAAGSLVVTNLNSATGAPTDRRESVLTFTVNPSKIRAHESDEGPKGMSPGDGFQETYVAPKGSDLKRVDAVGIATFGGYGTILGTLALVDGSLTYQGSTNDLADWTYAVTGGTGDYAGAAGTLTLAPISRGRVRVTIVLE